MYCGYITELHGLRKHSNADRLQCVNVFGNNIIVDLSYQEGQRVVFFPVDGQLSQEYAEQNHLLRVKDEQGNNIGGYMDPEKRNVRAIKLRGERSEGLVLPVETLSPWVDVETLKVGDKISSLNGTEICKKYIPKRTPRSASANSNNKSKKKRRKDRIKISFPLFKEHIDTEQLAYNKGAFKPGDRCTITLKMHGSSGRTTYTQEIIEKSHWWNKILHRPPKIKRQWMTVSGSRRVVLEKFDGSGYYGTNEFRKKYQDFFKGKLEKFETVYYEIVGYVDENTPIMGSVSTKDKELKKLYGDTMEFSYGCEKGSNDIYVYRMTMTNEDGYVVGYPDWLMRLRCEQMGVKCVPLFERFTFSTWEDLMERVEKYYDGPDPIGRTHIREGVVVRIENREKFKAYKHKNFTFKLVSGLIAESIADSESDMSDDILSEL